MDGLDSDSIAMDSASIVIGFPSGEIHIYNRKYLCHETVNFFQIKIKI
jgi:hypothetical protein